MDKRADIIEIKDYEDPRLDVYARMNERQLLHRDAPFGGVFVAESARVIRRALDAGCQPESLLLDEKQMDALSWEIVRECEGVPVFSGPPEVISSLTGIPMTRGMLACMKRLPLKTVEEMCRGKSRVAVLENVTNPTNVGAIIRSAAAMGMEAVLLNHACSDPFYRRAARVSMGTVFQVPWTYLEIREDPEHQDVSYVEMLQIMGFKTAAMALMKESVSIDDPQLMAEDKLAVFLGAEGDGLSPETIKACDYTVMIPMENEVDSLNVAAASAVAFWQLGLSRRKGKNK